jgi:hypothetical protein
MKWRIMNWSIFTHAFTKHPDSYNPQKILDAA